ncbi:intermembrane transport protein PqiB [Vibrio apostichopi]|uniref:intermembrane transport protein PqiB n=1 Tax=Vibrio apostichopi TaxID=3035453 RepID=UPI0025745C7A|nr:intermembrane transport protein PqiB [Vibrio sp. FE10]
MDKQNVSDAEVSKKSEISPVWIVPIIAVLVGCWMLFQYFNNRGPEITLILPDASGIEAGKTAIKSKNVHVGTITDVALSENYEYIIAKAQIDKKASRMINTETQFWVVEPHVGTDGISGLETILSGSYIELKPGKSSESQLKFDVLDTPPVAGPDTKGIRVVVSHNKANQLNVGEPVLHHGFVVGRVEKTSFDYQKKEGKYQLFIFAPYDGLIFEKTQFWLSSGIDVRFGANGLDVNFASIESILTGGVSFDVAESIKPGLQIKENLHEYTLYDNYDAVLQGKYTTSIDYVLLFEESVRGLRKGAPVEYRGVRIGTVDTVPLQIRMDKDGKVSNRIPILIKLEIERVSEVFRAVNAESFAERVKLQMGEGLRATLKTGNLLTGALFVDINFYEDEDPYEPREFDGYPVFPVVPGGFTEIQKQITDFLTKINELPLDATVANLNGSLASLDTTLKSMDELLDSEGAKALPQDLSETMKQLETTLESYDDDSDAYKQLISASEELEHVLKELRPLIKVLNDKPNALVFGSDVEEDPIPVKGVE